MPNFKLNFFDQRLQDVQDDPSKTITPSALVCSWALRFNPKSQSFVRHIQGSIVKRFMSLGIVQGAKTSKDFPKRVAS